MSGPSLQAMRAFRAVVELRSFRRAGERLGLGGSAVSRLVAGLEHELGVQLLQRTTRSLAVTEAGADFHDTVVRVLDDMEGAIDRLRDRGGHAQGLLRVSVPTSFALRWLAPRLPDFLVKHPDLRLDLSLNDRVVDLVAERFDCALRIGMLADSALYARRLGEVPRVLVAAPRYLKHAPPLRVPADLEAHDALVYTLSSTGAQWPFRAGNRMVNVPVTGRILVDNSVVLREMLVAGLGIALTPRFVVDDLLAAGKLRSLLPDCMAPPLGVHGVTTQRRHLPLKTRVWMDFLAQALAESGYGAAPG